MRASALPAMDQSVRVTTRPHRWTAAMSTTFCSWSPVLGVEKWIAPRGNAFICAYAGAPVLADRDVSPRTVKVTLLPLPFALCHLICPQNDIILRKEQTHADNPRTSHAHL